MFFFCESCLLDFWLITLSEESYRSWRECDREASIMRSPWSTRDCCSMNKSMDLSAHRDYLEVSIEQFRELRQGTDWIFGVRLPRAL